MLQSYRLASNGELVFQLFDVPTSTVHERVPAGPPCLPTTTRGRAQIARHPERVPQAMPGRTTDWQPLGATAKVSGVGFWNPVKTTAGARRTAQSSVRSSA